MQQTLRPYIASMVDAIWNLEWSLECNFENLKQFGIESWKIKFYFKRSLKLWKPTNVLPNHFEVKSACFDFLTLLSLFFYTHLYGCCMFKAFHVVWFFIFNSHIVHYNISKHYVRDCGHVPQLARILNYCPLNLENTECPFNIFSCSFLHLSKMLLFMVWFAQNNSKGGRFHLPTNSSMDKMYHSPWNQPFHLLTIMLQKETYQKH